MNMSYESVQEMFSRVAAQFAAQAAIERGARRVGYAELEAESNRLANFLIEGGVRKGTLVGLLTDNPISIITSILGVLKAGAVFVPLDPTFPDGRLRMMSQQVQPQFYVTETKHRDKVETREAKIICFDSGEYTSYTHTDHPQLPSDPDAPCSIYFTS